METKPIGETEQMKTNKKIDQMINLLEKLVNGSNQPTVIKIGDRTVEAISAGVARITENSSAFKTGGKQVEVN